MVQKKEKQWSPVGCVQGRVLWFCCCVCISQLLAGSFCASAAMFFFYVSFWLAELAADWLIVQGGYYMAAIAMRSSPIIPFRRDHREPPVPPPSTISPLFLLPSLSSCPPHPPPPPQHTCRAEWIELHLHSEQMGAEKDRSHAFSFSLPLARSLSSTYSSLSFSLSWLFVLAAQLFSNFIFSVWRVAFLRMQWMSPALFFKMQNGCAKA